MKNITLEEHIGYQKYLSKKVIRLKLKLNNKELPPNAKRRLYIEKSIVYREIRKPTFYFAHKEFKARKGIPQT